MMDLEQKRMAVKRLLAEKTQVTQQSNDNYGGLEVPIDGVESQGGNDGGSGRYIAPGLPIPTDMNSLATVGQGAARGIADVLGTPIDLATMGVNALGAGSNSLLGTEFSPIVEPTLGSDDIAGAFGGAAEELGYPVQEPSDMTSADKNAYNTVRFGAGAGVGAAGLASRVGKASRADQMLNTQQYVDDPIRQITGDAVGGAGSGYAVDKVENSLADSDAGAVETMVKQTIASLFGGGLATSGKNAADGIVRKSTQSITDRVGQAIKGDLELPDGTNASRPDVRRAAGLAQGKASDPLVASENIKQSLELTKEAGMSPLTTGAAADDVGLAAVEVKRRTEDPVPFIERDKKLNTQLAENVGDLRNPDADVTAPQKVAEVEASRQVDDVQSVADDVAAQKVDIEQQEIDTIRQTEELVEPVRMQRGKEAEASTELDSQIGKDGALGERTKVKNDAYDESAVGAKVEAESLYNVMKDINDSKSKLTLGDNKISEELMDSVRSFIPKKGTLEGPDGPAGRIPADDVLKLRRDITGEIEKARQAKDYAKADTYKELKDKINETINLDPQFKDANKVYSEEYAPFFARGYGKKWRDTVQKGDGTGVSDSAKTAQFFLNNTPDAAADLKRIVDIAPDPEAATNAVEKYMAADLASKLGDKPSPRAIKNWLADKSDQLDEFPEVKEKFEKLQRSVSSSEASSDSLNAQVKQIAGELKKAEGNVRDTKRRVNKGVLGTLINEDPDKYVKTIMGSKDRIKKVDDVLKLVGSDKKAKEGLKRAFTEYIIDNVTGTNTKAVGDTVDGPVMYNKIAKLMDSESDVLKKVYSPGEMMTLRRSQKIMAARGNLSLRGTTGSDTAQKQRSDQIWTIFTGLARLKYGMIRGGGITRTGKDASKALPSASARAEDMFYRSMLDPEIAVFLLDTPVKQLKSPAGNKKLRKIMGITEGARQSNRVISDEEDDE